MIYLILKTVHLISAILSVGTLFFWVFIIKRAFVGSKLLSAENKEQTRILLRKYTRSIMKINVAILVLSGIALLNYHSFEYILALKVCVGFLIIVLFYLIPLIHKSIDPNSREKVQYILNYGMFVASIVVVVSAKFLYYF